MKRKKKTASNDQDCCVLVLCDGPYFVSVVLTDVRTALIGVGLVVKDDKSGLSILDKGKVERYS